MVKLNYDPVTIVTERPMVVESTGSASNVAANCELDEELPSIELLIDECRRAQKNTTYFQQKDDDLGQILLPARQVYSIIVVDGAAKEKVRREPACRGDSRTTKDCGHLAVMLVLCPRDALERGLCSDYGRIVDHAHKERWSDDKFSSVFASGYKNVLNNIRTTEPKRRRPKASVPQDGLMLVLKLGSSKTILAQLDPHAHMVDLSDAGLRMELADKLIQAWNSNDVANTRVRELTSVDLAQDKVVLIE